MKYVAPYDMTVTSLSGRSVELKKGEPTHCPPQMHAELISRGVVPAEEVDEKAPDAPVELTPDERKAAFFKAFEVMALRNARGDFGAAGTPHAAALAKELGWTAVDAKERDAMWAAFQAGKAE